MNSSGMQLCVSAVAGLLLGSFYFGGLWLTVRKLPGFGNPGILILGSFVVRLLVTMCGMYLVMDGKWERLVTCLAGFLLMRIVLTRLLGPARSESRLSA